MSTRMAWRASVAARCHHVLGARVSATAASASTVEPDEPPHRECRGYEGNDLLQALLKPPASYASSPIAVIKNIEPLNLVKRQLEMESLDYVQIEPACKLPAACSGATGKKRRLVDDEVGEHEHYAKLEAGWVADITERLDKIRPEILRLMTSMPDHNLKPLFEMYAFDICFIERLVPTNEELLELIMHEVRYMINKPMNMYTSCCGTLGTRLIRKVRRKVQAEAGYIETLANVHADYVQSFAESADQSAAACLNHREAWLDAAEEPGCAAFRLTEPLFMDRSLAMRLGKCVVDELVAILVYSPPNAADKRYKVFQTEAMQPSKSDRLKQVKTIDVKEEVVRLAHLMSARGIVLDTIDLPSVAPPLPWLSRDRGAFLLNETPLVRILPHFHHKDAVRGLARVPRAPDEARHRRRSEPLSAIYDALNQLGATAWQINGPLLDVIMDCFQRANSEVVRDPERGQQLADEYARMKLPQHSAVTPWRWPATRSQFTTEQRNNQSAAIGLWWTTQYRLSIAKHLRDKFIWFPHSMDFRGRVYPVAPHLHHMSEDLIRALLLFGKGEPLGVNGLDWLKIHCVNLTGTMKRDTLADRLQHANDMMPRIIGSALNPMAEKWWLDADDPWQTLACCMEIEKAQRCSEPTEHICHLPVHQDGSCNGLQHYAAMGRDRNGGEQVNLTNADAPGDVYSTIARKVESMRQEAVDSDDTEVAAMAKLLDGGIIQRKIIKQTVMTSVYGVTTFGAKEQIRARLAEVAVLKQQEADVLAKLATYLTRLTFKALQNEFPSAKLIEQWFGRAATELTRCGKFVEWTTPLGLSVVQPYAQPKAPGTPSKPHRQRHKNAFPPNLIHSLDSTHMLLTALYCGAAGVPFAAVHDSFWTLPNHVDGMGRVCREQFVALHSQPLLERLADSFVRSVDDLDLSDVAREHMLSVFRGYPKDHGDLRLPEVLDSTYFFS